jgi:hypothetical protein
VLAGSEDDAGSVAVFTHKHSTKRLNNYYIQDFCGLRPLYDYLSAVFVSAVTHPHPRHLVSEDPFSLSIIAAVFER